MNLECQKCEKKHKDLIEKWYEKYEHLEKLDGNKTKFTWDGPSNWTAWCDEKNMPRILFLLKEAHSEYEPNQPVQSLKGIHLNLARWRYVIKELFKNINQNLAFPTKGTLNPSDLEDIAIVEVKKLDENNKISPTVEIEKYAREDKDLLKEQIDLIGPHVVLCCNTQTSYDIIYEGTYYKQISPDPEGCTCWWFDNRLVIEFHHPASRFSPEHLYTLLCTIIKEGNVFEKFNWTKEYKCNCY